MKKMVQGERGKEEEGMLLKACSSLSSEEEERGRERKELKRGKLTMKTRRKVEKDLGKTSAFSEDKPPRGVFLLLLLFSLVSLTTREEIEITKSDISEFGRGNHLRGCLGCLRSDKSLFVLPSKEITPPPPPGSGGVGAQRGDLGGLEGRILPHPAQSPLLLSDNTISTEKTEISSNFELVLDGPTRLRGAST